MSRDQSWPIHSAALETGGRLSLKCLNMINLYTTSTPLSIVIPVIASLCIQCFIVKWRLVAKLQFQFHLMSPVQTLHLASCNFVAQRNRSTATKHDDVTWNFIGSSARAIKSWSCRWRCLRGSTYIIYLLQIL